MMKHQKGPMGWMYGAVMQPTQATYWNRGASARHSRCSNSEGTALLSIGLAGLAGVTWSRHRRK